MPDAYQRFERIDRILRQILEAAASERQALLEEMCGDDESLRQEIDRLLGEIDRGETLDPLLYLSSAFLAEPKDHPMIGSSLSHYEITAKLGAGGMGEVYRGKDTKLGRDVAIKVLPQDFARDRERLARFEREAKVLASLNHPNIAQVYGFEQHEGTHFLVMELAEGETLAQRIERGPIPVGEAVAIARQIAEALEAAHEKGIVHRDLKPANVNVVNDVSMAPKVKVLDFGLAKGMVPTGSSGELTNSPTLTQHTAAGVLMGTASYMSPEQARGQEADGRADIWAFGCVLFEMVTGKGPFEGDSVSEILAAVLKDDPDLARFPSDEAVLKKLVSRCLRKDPRQRVQAIGDVRIELEEELDASPVFEEPRSKGRMQALLPITAVAALAGALSAFLLSQWLLSSGAVPNERRPYSVTVEAPPLGNPDALYANSVSISADGSRLAIVGQGSTVQGILVREAQDPRWRALPNAEGMGRPRLSADGQWLLAGGEQKRMPFSGGAAEDLKLGEMIYSGFADWFDESRLLLNTGTQLILIGPGEVRETLFDCEDVKADCFMLGLGALVASDSAIVCLENARAQHSLFRWKSGGEPVLLIEDGCFPKKVGSRLLFVRQGEIWAVALEPDGMFDGKPVSTGIETYRYNFRSYPHFDVAENGTLFYLDPIPEAQIWQADRSGRLLTRVPIRQAIRGSSPTYIRASPDGERALVTNHRKTTVVDLENGVDGRPVDADTASWLRADKFVAANHVGENLLVVDVRGQITERISLEHSLSSMPWNYIDGTSLSEEVAILSMYTGAGASDQALIKVDLAKRKPVVAWLRGKSQGPQNVRNRHSSVSPDGRWIAWETGSSGRLEINGSPLHGSPQPSPVSTEGGSQARWSKDGKTLYFVDKSQALVMGSRFSPDQDPPFSPPFRAFPLPERTISAQHVAYDTLPDDGFLFVIAEKEIRHRLVFNWLADVDNRLAAAN